MLEETKLEPDFPWNLLAAATDNLSGSDLKELCRNAAMVPVREYLREHAGHESVMAKAQLEVEHIQRTLFRLIHVLFRDSLYVRCALRTLLLGMRCLQYRRYLRTGHV